MSEQKWQRSSLRHLTEELDRIGYWVSHTTIARLLKGMEYSLKANVKRLSGSDHPDRDRQFQYIATQKALFQQAGLPVISVDTKKKELIGNFKNPGQEWCLNAAAVNDHDFEQDALGKAVPYGIYDLKHNHGYVYVGQSADTPQFAVEVIVRWWARWEKSVSQCRQNPNPGRCGWQQWLSSTPVETTIAGTVGRPTWLGSDRVSLSNRCIEMEPNRTSFVWPNQYQLGWQTLGNL